MGSGYEIETKTGPACCIVVVGYYHNTVDETTEIMYKLLVMSIFQKMYIVKHSFSLSTPLLLNTVFPRPLCQEGARQSSSDLPIL